MNRCIALIGMVVLLAGPVSAADSEAGDEAVTATQERSPEEIIAELDGVVIPRDGGGWMQVKMEGVRLTLRFYDEKAKQVAPDVDRATVLFKPVQRKQERRVLIPWVDDPKVLSHGRPIRHPHIFVLIINTFRGESNEAVETYRINYPEGWEPPAPPAPPVP